MSELPEGWVRTTLGELCEVNPKHSKELDRSMLVSFVPMPAVSDELGIILGHDHRPLEEVWKGYTHFQEDDVIFAKITPCMENGKIAVARGLKNGLACGSTEFYVFRCPEGVSNQLLWYFLRQKKFREDAERHMAGAVGHRRVPRAYLEETVFSLPPENEQGRIVFELKSSFVRSRRATAELDKIANLIERYRNGVLRYTFSSGSGPIVALKKVVTAEAPIRYGIVQPGEIRDRGIDLIRVCDLVDGKIAWGSLRSVAPEIDKKYIKARVQNDDVLVSVVGTIGRVAIVSGQQGPTNIARAIARIRPDQNKVIPEWLFYRLQAEDCQERFLEDAREVARKTLNISLIQETVFPLPSIEVQREQLESLNHAHKLITKLQRDVDIARKGLSRLEERLLASAFEGKLVPQDPNDEPAAVLLKRIREEREKAGPASRRGRRGKGAGRQTTTRKGRAKMENKKRSDVGEEHLSELLQKLGGSVEARELWQKSEMDVNEFYKLLRDEVKAGRIIESENKERLEVGNAA